MEVSDAWKQLIQHDTWKQLISTTNLAACVCVCVQNLTNFCPYALISTPKRQYRCKSNSHLSCVAISISLSGMPSTLGEVLVDERSISSIMSALCCSHNLPRVSPVYSMILDILAVLGLSRLCLQFIFLCLEFICLMLTIDVMGYVQSM